MRKARIVLIVAVLVLAAPAASNAVGQMCWFCHFYTGLGWVCELNGISGEQRWTYCVEQNPLPCAHNGIVCYAH